MTHYNKKTYRIDNIDFGATPRDMFTVRRNGVEELTSYADYFYHRYGLKISEKDMNQPMLVSVPKKKDINKGIDTNIYLVPSFCNMTGLSDQMRADYTLMGRLSKYLHKPPNDRVAKLKDFVDSIKNNTDVS